MTLSPRECYNRIEQAVQCHIDRLLNPKPGPERSKAQEIAASLDRLFLATIEKYPEGVNIRDRFTICQINSEQLSKIDLTTMEAMLNAEIHKWESEIPSFTTQGIEINGRKAGYKRQISLRTALNISLHNVFNVSGGTWGPLWGKAKELDLVEKELKA